MRAWIKRLRYPGVRWTLHFCIGCQREYFRHIVYRGRFLIINRTLQFTVTASFDNMDLIGKVNSSNISRYSSLERLPNELLHKIFQHIITPAPAKYWLVPHSLPGMFSFYLTETII